MEIIHRPLSKGGNTTNHPRKIIIHAMGEFIKDPLPQHATEFLERYGLSAHALVDSQGRVFVCRSDHQGAYHARGHNKDSLGIEFLVPGQHDYASFLEAIKDPDWVTVNQWKAGITFINNWVRSYQIPISRIYRHSDVSPGRKVDPGPGFDFEKLKMELNIAKT